MASRPDDLAPPAPERSPAAELAAGALRLSPLLVGVVPFGVIYGVLALAGGLSPAAAMAMSSVVFAGSAQFLLARLAGLGAAAPVMVATVALVNLRHALYSASVAPALAHLPRRWRAILAYLLTDEAYAAAVGRMQEPGRNRHWFLLGAGLALWSGWQASTAAGILIGRGLPRSLPLDFALPLTFIAIVVPMVRSRAALAAAAVAAAVALLASGWPYQLGLLTAALSGIATGWICSRRGARP
ncbi:MAG TPA: AzlC family ABC transporter permease [Anaeromyxobacter sp.]|nr:AzlC family ABC transporter permease [Anaeromyxobacter sp.]